MKKTLILSMIVIAVCLESCIVKSIHPFFKESDVVYRKEMEGEWTDQDNNRWRIHKNPFTSNSYELHYSKKGRDVTFAGHLFYLEDEMYIDMMASGDNSPDIEIFDVHLVPTHSIAKVSKLTNDEVVIRWFDEEWLRAMFDHNRIKISHELVMDENPQSKDDGFYLLTASTEELQKFVTKYGNDENAYDDDLTLQLTR